MTRVSQSLSWKLTLYTSALCFSFPVSNFQKVPYSSLQRNKWYLRQVKEYLCTNLFPPLPINKILKTKFWIWFSLCGLAFQDNNITLFIWDSFLVILVSEFENFYWSCPSVLIDVIALKCTARYTTVCHLAGWNEGSSCSLTYCGATNILIPNVEWSVGGSYSFRQSSKQTLLSKTWHYFKYYRYSQSSILSSLPFSL